VLPEEGFIVFDYYGYSVRELGSGETYRQAFTDDGAVVTLTGDPEVVDIHEIVAPDADADRETVEKSATDHGAAPAATPPPAADNDTLALEIRARSIAARARAATLS
jgi:hypothetical protein